MALKTQGQAINEAVFLLSALAPRQIESLKLQYPALADELKVGIYAGEEPPAHPPQDLHLVEKADVMLRALAEASRRAEEAMACVSAKIKKARLRRLVSQAFVLIGSSSLLGAVALQGKLAAVGSAVLTLLAALGNLFAEHQEKLLNPQASSIYEAFQKLGEGAYKAHFQSSQLQLMLKFPGQEAELKDLIAQANALCEQLNGWLIQLLNQLPSSSSSGSVLKVEVTA
jgi:hypothetical protein